MLIPTIDIRKYVDGISVDYSELLRSYKTGDVILVADAACADLTTLLQTPHASVWVHLKPSADGSTANSTGLADVAASVLDAGAAKVVFDLATGNDQAARELIETLKGLPHDRTVVAFEAGHNEKESVELISLWSPACSGFILTMPFLGELPFEEKEKETAEPSQRTQFVRQLASQQLKDIIAAARREKSRSLAFCFPALVSSATIVGVLDRMEANVVVASPRITISDPEPGKIALADAFCACLVTDRSDGLFTTVVCDESGIALGVAYSSAKSITEALKTGQGVYHSRSRGLWYKGLTSGATQALLRLDVDCDSDALRFTVRQNDPGFCHLNTRTCFGPDKGLTALDALLRARRASAPAGSYTARLFSDPALLKSKIMEEAEELCDAKTPEDIAWETADLIYFALARCASAGVSLADVESQLDRRAKKISRRPGNAKPKWAGVGEIPTGAESREKDAST